MSRSIEYQSYGRIKWIAVLNLISYLQYKNQLKRVFNLHLHNQSFLNIKQSLDPYLISTTDSTWTLHLKSGLISGALSSRNHIFKIEGQPVGCLRVSGYGFTIPMAIMAFIAECLGNPYHNIPLHWTHDFNQILNAYLFDILIDDIYIVDRSKISPKLYEVTCRYVEDKNLYLASLTHKTIK